MDPDESKATYFTKVYPDPIYYNSKVNWMNVPSFFGLALYSFDINGVITEVRKEMLKTYKFPRVLLMSMIIEACIYIFIGSIGKNDLISDRLYCLWSIY